MDPQRFLNALYLKESSKPSIICIYRTLHFLQVNLGNMYYHGLGVDKDWNMARQYYKKAAPSNHNARLLLEELETEMKKNGMKIEG